MSKTREAESLLRHFSPSEPTTSVLLVGRKGIPWLGRMQIDIATNVVTNTNLEGV